MKLSTLLAEPDGQWLKVAIKSILHNKECYSLNQLAITGDDIISLGNEQGSQIGKILNNILSDVIDGNLANDKDKILEYIKNHNAKL
jgi:tRNA nucleotidyltransferase (CCA-adding enzyme)